MHLNRSVRADLVKGSCLLVEGSSLSLERMVKELVHLSGLWDMVMASLAQDTHLRMSDPQHQIQRSSGEQGMYTVDTSTVTTIGAIREVMQRVGAMGICHRPCTETTVSALWAIKGTTVVTGLDITMMREIGGTAIRIAAGKRTDSRMNYSCLAPFLTNKLHPKNCTEVKNRFFLAVAL